MKISKEHYEYLKSCIATQAHKAKAHREMLVNSDRKPKDMDKRVRWDFLWATVPSMWITDNIYPLGCDDTHIDTALRSIQRELLL